MHEVRLSARQPEELLDIVPQERLEHLLQEVAPRMRAALSGHSVINVNSTASGGGVAEMLQVLLTFSRGADVDARWMVIEGEPGFFAVTKRLHHRLHGQPGDGGPLGGAEHQLFEQVSHVNAENLAITVHPGDVAILHDPQTAGLAQSLAAHDIPVVWRCHVGVDDRNEFTREGWDFLRPYLEPYVAGYVFTRASYAPDWVPRERLQVIQPAIDPLSAKNQPMTPEDALCALAHVGIVEGEHDGLVAFRRADGSPGRIERYADVVRTGPPPDPAAPLVVQVSRWDPLKDMLGVMTGFVEHVLDHTDAHLVLAGPVVTAVADDPEAAEVLERVWAEWRALPHAARSRVQLVCLPMSDVEENAAIVNALQRHASVVTQKSLAEGFGLTVTEAMYKGAPVVASSVGGIPDQITDGVQGLLVPDPGDLEAFGAAVSRLLDDRSAARQLGQAAHDRVVEAFLPDISLARWEHVLSLAMGSR